MNRTLKNITIVCLCIILFGIGLTGTGLLLGGTLFFSYDIGAHKMLTYKDMEYKITTDNIDAFTSIDITTDALDITIESGDTYSISYPESEYEATTYTVKDNVLTVTSKDNFKNGIFFFNSYHTDRRCVITVPDSSTLNDITISSRDGDCKITKQSVGNMNLTVKYGDTILEKCTIENGNYKLSDGDLLLDDCEITEINGNLSYGDCTIKNCTINENVFDLSDGDFTLENTVSGSTDVSMKYGGLSITKSSIDILTAQLQDGDCTIHMDDSITSYSANLYTDDGDIIINGQEQGEQYHSNGSDKKSIDVSTKYGDIEIKYQ